MDQCIKRTYLGAVLKRTDRNGNFKVWPLDRDGLSIPDARMVILTGTAGRKDLCAGKRVPYETVSSGERVDFGRLVEGTGTAIVRSRNGFIRRRPLYEYGARTRFTIRPEIRTKPLAESPEIGQNIRDAFAGEDMAGVLALVIYDSLLLDGRIRHGSNAAPYVFAVMGKTKQDVMKACAAISLSHNGAMLYGDRDLDQEVFILEETRRVRIIGGNGTQAALFTTIYNPSPGLDTLLRGGGRGNLATIAVAGLCRVQGKTPLIETEALRLCMACARFDAKE